MRTKPAMRISSAAAGGGGRGRGQLWPKATARRGGNFFGGDALNQTLGSDCTPLHLAAEADFVPCVEYLLDEGADVDARTRSTHETPLHKAGRARPMQAARVLVDRGASIVARDNMRRRP